jgi:hypothetical protein
VYDGEAFAWFSNHSGMEVKPGQQLEMEQSALAGFHRFFGLGCPEEQLLC